MTFFQLRRLTSAALWLASALIAVAWAPTTAAAQGCAALDNTCEDHRPDVSISPTGGTFLDSNQLSVTVTWGDDRGLVSGSRSITVQTTAGTSTVTSNFDYVAASSLAATSSGQITLGPAGTTTTLTAEICDNASPSQCQEASAVYTYGGASQLPYGPAFVSLAPQAQGVLTVSPYDVTASYSTAPYVSQDVSRSVTLAYTSSQALAKAFVQVDALNNSTNPPTGMSIAVRDPSTGTTVAEAYYLARANYNRLAVDWRATSLATGPKVYDVIVTSRWEISRGAAKDTTIQSSAKQVTILLLNDFASAYGPGWNIAGLQRVITGANGAMIAHGDGTAVFFTSGVDGFEPPVGEWSTLAQVGSEYIRSYPDSGKAAFSVSSGRLQYTQDRFGNRTSFVYDGSGRLTQVIGPVADTTRLSYPGGLLATITDPGGRVTNIYYGGNGSTTEVVEIWDPAGRMALKTLYDGQHRLTTTLGQASTQAVRHVYDAADRIAADSLPLVLANGSVQRPVVRYRSWELASRGGASVGSPAGAINPDTLHADVTDTRGYTTRSWLDAFRLPLRVIGPMNDTTTIVRNLDGTPAAVTSPSGAVTTYTWDGPRLVGTYQSDPATYTDVETDPSTDLPLVVKSGGMRTTYRYGSRGQLLRTWVGTDSTRATVFTYASDSSYRVATITDPQGHQSVFTYQPTGRRNLATASVPDANGNAQVTTYTYDTYGRAISVTDPVGTTSTLYDAINRPTRVVNARNDTTWFALSGVDTVSTVTDAAHKTYTFNRNKLGWLLSEIDPNGRTRSYTYDLAGNVTRSINRNSDTVTITYDTLSRVRTRIADGVTTTFSYGAPRDFWTAAVNSSTTDTIRFDRLGRPVLEVSVIGGTRYARTSHFRSEGMRDTLTYTTPAGVRTVTYGFDTELRLQRLTGPGGTSDSTRITYSSEGLPTAVRMPTGLTQTAGYFPSHAPEWQAWSAGPVHQAFAREWTYDALNRVSTRTSGARRRQYEYDAISQLIVKRDSTSSLGPPVCEDPLDPTTCTRPLVWQEDSVATYSYDRVHNRTDNGATFQTTSNRYATFGGYTLGYDNEGNLTSKTASGYSQTYSWNDLGQLASVTTNGTTVSYLYNGFGMRVKRTQGSAITWSIYDGDDLLLELDGSGNVLREYTMYPGIDAPHSLRTWSGSTPGSANYYVLEQPGHVTGLVNSSSQVANQYRYTPWGQAESTNETTAQPLRFMARELDAATGLYYVRARWYDPALARFNSEDPLRLDAGINTYTYVTNNPIGLRDPTGKKVCTYDWKMQQHIERTYHLSITWVNGCATDLQRWPGSQDYEELQDEFIWIAAQQNREVWVHFTSGTNSSASGRGAQWQVRISGLQSFEYYGYIREEGGCGRQSPWYVDALIVHEFGHIHSLWTRGFLDNLWGGQVYAIERENMWNRAFNREVPSRARPMRDATETCSSFGGGG